jgi:hypothetical protein
MSTESDTKIPSEIYQPKRKNAHSAFTSITNIIGGKKKKISDSIESAHKFITQKAAGNQLV